MLYVKLNRKESFTEKKNMTAYGVILVTYFLRHVSAPMSVISLPVSASGTWLVNVMGHMVTHDIDELSAGSAD